MTEGAAKPLDSVRRRIEFDVETWHALHRLSLDSMRSLQELAVLRISRGSPELDKKGEPP